MDKLLEKVIMNPSDSYSPETVRLMLDQHTQAIERLGYFAAAILVLWTLLAIYVIVSNRLTSGRLKKIENSLNWRFNS